MSIKNEVHTIVGLGEILRDLFPKEKKSQEESCKLLIKKYKLDLVCVTKGKNRSLLITERETVKHNGY